MCNRFDAGKGRGMTPADQALEDRFTIAFRGLAKPADIRPTDPALVLARGQKRILQPVEMRWGWARSFGPATLAQAEHAEGSMWREGYRSRRCAVPLAAFYEGAGQGSWRMFPTNPAVDLWAAGMWESQPERLSFAMFTIPTPEPWEQIHNRFLALLQPEQLLPWLDGEISVAEAAGAVPEGVEARAVIGSEPFLPGMS